MILSLLALSPGFAQSPVAMHVPVVAVKTTDEGSEGSVIVTELRLEHRKPGVPVQVAITEDTPSGSGSMMRAALWQAITTTGLNLGHSLSGTHVDWYLPGRIDGPSAGAMITVALMSALQLEPLPDDFVITGTVRPDGSIGVVGGIRYKMVGAKEHGLKRFFYPKHSRAELEKGEWVDLQQHCEDLGLECTPVSTVLEAYAKVHLKQVPLSSGTRPVEFSKDTERKMVEKLDQVAKNQEWIDLKSVKGFLKATDSPFLRGSVARSWDELNATRVSQAQGNIAYAYSSAARNDVTLRSALWAARTAKKIAEIADVPDRDAQIAALIDRKALFKDTRFATEAYQNMCVAEKVQQLQHDTKNPKEAEELQRVWLFLLRAAAYEAQEELIEDQIDGRSYPHLDEVERLYHAYLDASVASLDAEKHQVEISKGALFRQRCWFGGSQKIHEKVKEDPSALLSSVKWHSYAIAEVASLLERREWGGEFTKKGWTYSNRPLMKRSTAAVRQMAIEEWSLCDQHECEGIAVDLLALDGKAAEEDVDESEVYARYLGIGLYLRALRMASVGEGPALLGTTAVAPLLAEEPSLSEPDAELMVEEEIVK